MNKRTWPDRFEVTFSSVEGEEHSYIACTWQHQEKAIAMAAEFHRENRRPQIYSVAVLPLGPAEKGPAGLVKPNPTDLIDRMEW